MADVPDHFTVKHNFIVHVYYTLFAVTDRILSLYIWTKMIIYIPLRAIIAVILNRDAPFWLFFFLI